MTIQTFIEWGETYVTAVIRGRRATWHDHVMRALLFVLSRAFRSAVLLRLTLYRQRVLRHRALGCLVVSIGNLTVGGTGKTPVVEIFARTLAQKGRKVAILSRGYRSKPPPWPKRVMDALLQRTVSLPPRVVSDGKSLLLNSEMAGDEPYMLAANLKEVVILTDPDRVKSGRYAIQRFGCDTLILDDGFQYLALRPRINILLVDSTSPFHNHHLLPRGLLREPIRSLRRANLIFLTKSDGSHRMRHLRRFIHKHNHHAEIIECSHRPLYLQDLYTKERRPLDLMHQKRIAAISGIAAPESFEAFLRPYRGGLVYAEQFADHHRFTQQEIIDFINAAVKAQAEIIVTTEKDAVRFAMLERRDLPIYFLRVEIGIISGKESFDDCISRICFAPNPNLFATRYDDDYPGDDEGETTGDNDPDERDPNDETTTGDDTTHWT